jgi:hypothetical protein
MSYMTPARLEVLSMSDRTRSIVSVRQRRDEANRQARIDNGHDVATLRSIAYYGSRQDPVSLAELTTRARKALPKGTFAIPETRSYPIPDEAHARNALARVAQHGTPEEKARVRAAVKRKFPNIKTTE